MTLGGLYIMFDCDLECEQLLNMVLRGLERLHLRMTALCFPPTVSPNLRLRFHGSFCDLLLELLDKLLLDYLGGDP